MLQNYTSNEFYADRLSHRLALAKKWLDRILFFTVAAVFVTVWLGLVLKKEDAGALMDRFSGTFAKWIFEEPYSQERMLGIFGLVFLANAGPSIVFFVRKNWVFPKASMTLRGYATVHSKEVVKLPRSRGATKTPKAFYVYVSHPVTGNVIPVEISEGWYTNLEVGNRVNVHYHPSSDNVVYLINS
ncbi:hypothetical protein J2Y45_003277 [Dyadobacter sp. BE34]|uniref:DUF3592 domain-containing protein n=1 Tax=Dyadobacter fermentans TaxID=94254 RepID=A0ABU1QY80_9BACT|nr:MULTISPECIES: hypothetical protein [Dyadobacter]MDR6806085.1 hypothetical protein [Dyadobacter fermentans]MDR7043826.1 hypothetical protein [Dyadobacter sp. BE242]MDR7198137.1 hypothetical protein [Dyadobacter sp. BE34]MDR7216100.1 hypothetical protein [Dyadobacter sp. BE31]MDR7264374.1 hypothetical protein [Dyadobacter sp. BE32]